MNCFCHSLPFLDKPYFAVGSCIPDWLSAIDRKVRARERLASKFVDSQDEVVAALAGGVVQHHRDDHWFHQTRAFTELSMRFSIELRELFRDAEKANGETGFRAGFLGHILVEILLDAYLIETNPGKLELYYSRVAAVDPAKVQQTVNLFSTRSTNRLVNFIDRFLQVRYLFDYLDDRGLLFRVNNVMKRVKLKTLGEEILDWLPAARRRVYQRSGQLLLPHNDAIP